MSAGTARDTRKAALDLLARRARTAAEIRTRLIDAGHAPERVETVLAECTTQGWLDDRGLAQDAAEALAADGHAAIVIAERLERRGVDAALASDAAQRAAPDALAQAIDHARRYLARHASLGRRDPAVQARRVAAALTRRGHDEDTVNAAVRAVNLPTE